MINSYNRFQLTLKDLQDCYANLTKPMAGEEFHARCDLIELCREIVEKADRAEAEFYKRLDKA